MQTTSDSAEAKALLDAVAAKIEASTAQFSTRHLTEALQGLRSLRDSKPLQRVLSVVAARIASCNAGFSAGQIGILLAALGSAGDSAAVHVTNLKCDRCLWFVRLCSMLVVCQAVLDVVSSKIANVTDLLAPSVLCNALSGLSGACVHVRMHARMRACVCAPGATRHTPHAMCDT